MVFSLDIDDTNQYIRSTYLTSESSNETATLKLTKIFVLSRENILARSKYVVR